MKFYIKLSQRFIGVWGTKQPGSLGTDLDKPYRTGSCSYVAQDEMALTS